MANRHVLYYGEKIGLSFSLVFGLGFLFIYKRSFRIQHSLIHFLKIQIYFIKHILQNYYKKVFLDVNFNCQGNKNN